MKKLVIIPLSVASFVSAQFSVQISADERFPAKEMLVYTINGSKEILIAKQQKSGNTWQIKHPQKYVGMMKAYFPESNSTLNFVSENKDVKISFVSENGKIKDINYHDEANRLMNDAQSLNSQQSTILPVLEQIKGYYKPSSEFYQALQKETQRLNSAKVSVDIAQHPFVHFYLDNYNRYLNENLVNTPSQQDLLNFLVKSDDLLETSLLVRPVLVAYLQSAGNANSESAAQKLLDAADVESPRGQMLLSELIDIFDAYGMSNLKQKFLTQANGLKCTITDRLAATIKLNKNTEIGATFPDYKFVQATNTKAKNLSDVKADRKLIIFWSSTCSHCEKEVPQLIPHYQDFKKKNYEVVAFSLDTSKTAWENSIRNFPWINDTELRGWNSTYGEIYNIRATPTYFILDSRNKILSKPEHLKDALEDLGIR
ncbi:redoxin domain-containing protein [Cruoricaptor ignavus]|uniref:Redoxin domain-containing protein n=1 Tax=Cruoricaptor ignavus TaxID=1118202 RepID=A0A7M1T419_9FLAO|nr:thioredoxin family protein [Cruoricaptor ignavus]QOR74491.1 redoxin domain-containing protein [Cruoricaptor ignavus]